LKGGGGGGLGGGVWGGGGGGGGGVGGGGGGWWLEFIGVTPDSSTILVLNKFSRTDEDSVRLRLTSRFTSVL